MPLQEVIAGQLLEAAKQPEAAAIAYAKAKKQNAGFVERFIENSSLNVKSNLMGISRKKSDSKKYSISGHEDSGRIVRVSNDAASNKPEEGSSENTDFSKHEKISEENSSLPETLQPVCIFEEAKNERYVNNNDGTITDIETGLMWKRCSEGLSGVDCEDGEIEEYQWEDARRFLKNFEYAGYPDWRLPTVDEIKTLVWCSCGKRDFRDSCNKDSVEPTINHQAFPNTLAWSYLSLELPYSADGSVERLWCKVYFDDGFSSCFSLFKIGAVRLVRDWQ